MLDCPGPNVVGHTRARDVVREPVFIEHYIRVNGNKRVKKKKKEKKVLNYKVVVLDMIGSPYLSHEIIQQYGEIREKAAKE